MRNTLLKFQLPILFFGIFECRNTANTSPIDHSGFFFLNNLNFLLSKSRFYTSSNTNLFVYKLKNAALCRLAARQSISGKPILWETILNAIFLLHVILFFFFNSSKSIVIAFSIGFHTIPDFFRRKNFQ
jgi:hypothetical protein